MKGRERGAAESWGPPPSEEVEGPVAPAGYGHTAAQPAVARRSDFSGDQRV